jgi:hypothetical protein
MKLETKAALIGAGAGVLGVALFTGQTTRAQDPAQLRDNTYMSIRGTVIATSPDAFHLDYGGGVVTVEMADYDFYRHARGMMDSDQVEVFGVVDDDVFESKTIEASSVYVESLGTHFYPSRGDEADFSTWTASSPIEPGRVIVTGTVSEIIGREFIVGTGARWVRVDTASMSQDPLDDSGYLKVDVGDIVKVVGDIEPSLFDERELAAERIIELGS